MEFRLITLVILLVSANSVFAFAMDPNSTLLPTSFPIYVNKTKVTNLPLKGYVRKNLPINNEYNLVPGCYIACYSHQSKNSIYSINASIFVFGQIRVGGFYKNKACIPYPYQGKDISSLAEFKTLCNQKLPACVGSCWAGGDTEGWFGSEPIYKNSKKTTIVPMHP